MTDFHIGQYVRIWHTSWYGDQDVQWPEYGVIDEIDEESGEVWLCGRHGKEIATTVKELEAVP